MLGREATESHVATCVRYRSPDSGVSQTVCVHPMFW